ncbi:unnamed protein product [Candidula unifasciata]|uniref:Uncharacterized protein n=1 Tax=Candidula unifasciata TaxID=100452 RepID=A0A8S3ZCL4_9EUPU|nr:unnamed protein product [Candidula unifasciata]
MYLSRRSLAGLIVGAVVIIFFSHINSYVMTIKKNVFNVYRSSSFLVEISNDNVIDRVRKEKPACIHPELDVDDHVMMAFYKKLPKVVCKGEKNWVFVDNGTLRFSEEAKKIHKDFHCDYYPLIRGPGDYQISFSDPMKDIKDGANLTSDFFKIICVDTNNNTYENIHAGIHLNLTIKERLKIVKPPANGLGLSIAFLGFDSMSRMSWLRRMPLTRDYLVNELKAIEFQGYNIMGDGTPAALLPILTGKHEQELPEHGYVTSWADAQIQIAPFNYRLLGFEHSPVDYFMRPFYLAVDPLYPKYSPDCHASEPMHMLWFNWIRDIFNMYKDDPKFLFHFYTPLSHDDNNKITTADEDLKTFIQYLEMGGFLNNTLLLIMADHGARFADVRRTLSGKLEERLPYVSLRFPPWFETKYPEIIKNMRTNVNRLTTAFDLHETFKDVLKFDGAGMGDIKNRGISLFKEIPKSRTCADADVAAHWCACLSWQNVPQTDPDAKRALQTALDTLNNFTQEYRSDCALLSVGNVTMLSKLFTSDDVLKFKETAGDRGLEPIMSAETARDKVIYQLTFFTEPGHGEFEITLEHLIATESMSVNPKSISRINKYGNDPACILDKNREIRQYCYCKNNLS